MNTTKEVKEFCERVGITPAQFTGAAPLNGDLYIEGDVTIPSGFAPRVGGSLCLDNVTAVPAGFAPLAGSSLHLSRATIVGDGFAPIVGGSLFLFSATIVGDGFAPIVGDSLHLYKIITLPTDCTPMIGDCLYFNGGKPTEVKKLDATKPIEARDGKYIIADGLLTEVVSKRGNVWRVRRIGMDKISFLVTDGSGNFAHGDTLADARESLIYKISNRDTSKYERLSEDSELTFAAAIEMYRTITGACATGTRHFVESNKIEKKNYTIREIIDLTEGQYGHEQLVKFFRS